jgi:hypothetical protein
VHERVGVFYARRASEGTQMLQMKLGSWPYLVIQGRQGIMAPLERKAVPSKTPNNQRRNEHPVCHRVGYHLAFTKIGQEPETVQIRIDDSRIYQ